MDISQAAFDLIVREEDSSEAYYTRHYQHFEWPAGASGPTIGIGYDCGYVTKDELTADWSPYVSATALASLVRAVGLKGQSAANFVKFSGQSVTIPWSQALAEFSNREVPKWVAHVREALPNTARLNGDCLGALVSLAYNRGCSFNLPGPRYSEMRAIKAHMMTGQFDHIPDEFLSMRRLWPKNGDLWNRRGHEAALFDKGLAEMNDDHATPGQTTPPETP
jgi:hypothetical protein